jgi:hypothetical protein
MRPFSPLVGYRGLRTDPFAAFCWGTLYSGSAYPSRWDDAHKETDGEGTHREGDRIRSAGLR